MTPTDEFKAAQQKLLQRYNVNAESEYIDVDAVTGMVHVLRAGSGPPVVMVPGFGDPAAMWASLMGELDGYTLHAVDRPCFGLSGSAEHTTATFRRLAVDFLEGVLDALRLDRPLFVANSIGSAWTTWLALERPKRVAAMVHIGCPAFWLGTSAPMPLRLMSVRPIGKFLMSVMSPSAKQVESFGRNIGGVDLSTTPELRDLLLASQRMPGAQESIRNLLHAVVQPGGARSEISTTAEELAQITQPTLLVWGERDAFGSPEVARRAAEAIPNSELHVVPGAGHVPWVDHPREVAAVVDPFLSRRSDG